MKYLMKQTLMIKNKTFEVGTVVNASNLPKESVHWLLDQEIVVKIGKKEEQKILQDTVKGEEE